jgi:hypothetical protein
MATWSVSDIRTLRQMRVFCGASLC